MFNNLTVSGILTITNYPIIQYTLPILSYDVVNKAYIDSLYVASLNSPNTFTGLNVFNSLCPQTTITPVNNSDLCNKSYVDSVTTSLITGINNFTQTTTFTGGIICGSDGGSNQYLHGNLPSGVFDLLTNQTSTVAIGNATNSSIWRYNTYLNLYKTKNITSDITLTFPMFQTNIIRTTTANITIILPLINVNHIGLKITFIKNTTVTQNIIFTCSTGNFILRSGSVYEVVSDINIMRCGDTSCELVMSILSSGSYGWIQVGTNLHSNSLTWGESATNTSNNSICIGPNASISSTYSGLCIGDSSQVNSGADYGVAVGYNSHCNHLGGCAIGVNALTQEPNGMSMGNTTSKPYIALPLKNQLNQLYYCSVRDVGVYMVRGSALNFYFYPFWYSVTNLAQYTSQPTTTGAVGGNNGQLVPGTGGVGNYTNLSIDNADSLGWLVHPNYGLVAYNSIGYTSNIYVNFKNSTNNPVLVGPTSNSGTSSVRIYYNDIEQLSL